MYYLSGKETKIEFPKSTQYKIIFIQNLQTLLYDLSHFDPNIIDNRLSIKDIDAFFDNIYTRCDHFSSLKNGRRISRIALIIFCLLLILGIMLAIFGLGGSRQNDGQVSQEWTILVVILLVLPLGGITGSFCYGIWFITHIVKEYTVVIQHKVNEFNKHYAPLDIRMKLGSIGITWFELWLDFRAPSRNDDKLRSTQTKTFVKKMSKKKSTKVVSEKFLTTHNDCKLVMNSNPSNEKLETEKVHSIKNERNNSAKFSENKEKINTDNNIWLYKMKKYRTPLTKILPMIKNPKHWKNKHIEYSNNKDNEEFNNLTSTQAKLDSPYKLSIELVKTSNEAPNSTTTLKPSESSIGNSQYNILKHKKYSSGLLEANNTIYDSPTPSILIKENDTDNNSNGNAGGSIKSNSPHILSGSAIYGKNNLINSPNSTGKLILTPSSSARFNKNDSRKFNKTYNSAYIDSLIYNRSDKNQLGNMNKNDNNLEYQAYGIRSKQYHFLENKIFIRIFCVVKIFLLRIFPRKDVKPSMQKYFYTKNSYEYFILN